MFLFELNIKSFSTNSNQLKDALHLELQIRLLIKIVSYLANPSLELISLFLTLQRNLMKFTLTNFNAITIIWWLLLNQTILV